MRMIKSGLMVAATALLTSCGADNGAQANNEAAAAVNDAAPAPLAENAAVRAAAGTGAEGQYMIGKWSAIAEDCADTLEFRNDGKVTTPIGEANWTMSGDKLTIDHGDGSTPTTTTIKQLGADRIEVTSPSGRKETQKRC